ncbi:hypothetical protein ACWEP4_32740 [Streptomyces sp. NPDC004227]
MASSYARRLPLSTHSTAFWCTSTRRRGPTHTTAAGTGSQLAGECIKSLEAGKGDVIPPAPREALISDLKLCKEQFHERHRFIHGYLRRDDESQMWLTLKGSRQKGARSPEIHFTTSSKLWELAVEFHRLDERVLSWDIRYFGEPGDPAEGEPEYVSVKR